MLEARQATPALPSLWHGLPWPVANELAIRQHHLLEMDTMTHRPTLTLRDDGTYIIDAGAYSATCRRPGAAMRRYADALAIYYRDFHTR